MSPRAPRSPSSPLSPRMDSLAVPSQQRHRPTRQHGPAASANSLKLPSLPRFHPANFPSGHSSSASNTPPTNPNSPNCPTSPRQQMHRQYSEAQRQLYIYQRELLANSRQTSKTATGPNPVSPRLIPLGSPGPVTPLELEQQNAGSYFVTVNGSPAAQNELVERLMQDSHHQGAMGALGSQQIHSRPVASR